MSAGILNYSKTQPVAYEIRAGTIEWLFLVHRKLGGVMETFFQMVQLLDRFLSLETKILKIKEIELFTAVSLFISYKFEEVEYFDLDFLVKKIVGDKFSKKQIIEAEILFLKKIGFRVKVPTLQNYTDEILINVNMCKSSLRDINCYLNIITFLIDDFSFDYSFERLAKMTYLTSIRILFKTQFLKDDEFERLLKNVNIEDLQISLLIYKLIKQQLNENKSKIFDTFRTDVLKINK